MINWVEPGYLNNDFCNTTEKTCGMVLACAADKVSSGHAMSPTPTSHGRNLSAFLYHHSQMSAQGSLDLSSPAYQEALTREMEAGNPDNLGIVSGVAAPVARQEERTAEGTTLAKALQGTWAAGATDLNSKNVSKATGIARAGETDETQMTSRRAFLHGTYFIREAIWIQPQDMDLSRIVHSNVIVLSSPTSRIGSLILYFFSYKWKITMTSTRSILADYQRLTTLGKNCQWKTTLHCQARMRQISGSILGVPLLFSQGLLIWGWHEMGCHGRAFLQPSQ